MARTRTVHRCTSCGAASPKWAGRCDACGEWNTLVEELDVRDTATVGDPTSRPARIVDVVDDNARSRATGLAEVDRVLGGGLVPGSVTLVGGEPGIGKSTLVLQLLGAAAGSGVRSLYVSGEESAAQIRTRAERLAALDDHVWLVSETVLDHIRTHIAEVDPAVVVVDSVQTLHDPALGSAPGSVTQVRECANALVAVAKEHNVAVVLVGHVTKEGTLAGPRVLEHVVDTVLSFEGDRHHGLRLLRAVKHRFGPTAEIGLFQMNGSGLVAVDDPSGLFLADRVTGVSGSAIVPTVDGHRPLLVEVQALVADSALPQPRRSAQGIDGGRLSMLLAVLDRRVSIDTAGRDVYALAVGGARVADPGADAAIALAVSSSLSGEPIDDDLVVVGEVGLGGELRRVAHLDRRLAEAARLGFRRAIVPSADVEAPAGLEVLWAPTLAAAHAIAGIGNS
jgi:DNA repair protein RadA/Sms